MHRFGELRQPGKLAGILEGVVVLVGQYFFVFVSGRFQLFLSI